MNMLLLEFLRRSVFLLTTSFILISQISIVKILEISIMDWLVKSPNLLNILVIGSWQFVCLTLSRLLAEFLAPTNFLLPSMGRFFGRLLKAFCSLNYLIVFKATTTKRLLQICKSVNQSLSMVSVYS